MLAISYRLESIFMSDLEVDKKSVMKIVGRFLFSKINFNF